MYLNGQLDMIVVHPDTGKKVYVRYHDSKALRAANIVDYVEDYFASDIVLKKSDDLIIISKDVANESLKKGGLASVGTVVGIYLGYWHIYAPVQFIAAPAGSSPPGYD